MRPKYLVLDEPMAGLDPRGRREVLDTLAMLREKTGCAVIMVSHSMDDMARNAERIGVLSEGQLVKVGTPQEVFAEAELLTSMGLDVPQASLLAMALRKRGLDAPQDIYDLDGMMAYLSARRREHV